MTKPGLSVIIFAYNDVDYLVKAIDSIYNAADEVVIIDASTNEDKRLKPSSKYKKVRIFRTPAFGYPEISFMYARSKCKYEWILNMYSHEEVSPQFAHDANQIIETTKYDGLIINRNELNNEGKYLFQSTRNGWVRLFRKNKTTKTGFANLETDVDGEIGILPDKKYYINHHSDYQNILDGGAEYKYLKGYMTIEKVQHRVTYGSISDKASGLAKLLFNFYAHLKGAGHDTELSTLDYHIFFRLYWTKLTLDCLISRSGNMNAVKFGINYDKIKLRAFAETPKEERELELKLQIEQIRNGGPTKYLNLGNEEGMKIAASRSDKLKLSGADLLVALLKEKYSAKR